MERVVCAGAIARFVWVGRATLRSQLSWCGAREGGISKGQGMTRGRAIMQDPSGNRLEICYRERNAR